VVRQYIIQTGKSMWQSNFVEIGGLKFHYSRTDGEKPPVVLAHGITDNGLCWTSVAQALEANYDVIMLDARGHGLSDAPDTGYDWMTFVDDLHDSIQALALDKPPVLGHSMGALSALLLAARYPDSVGAILLEDPPPLWMPERETHEQSVITATERRNGLIGLKEHMRDELIEKQRADTPHWSDTELENWADAKLQVNLNVTDMFKLDARRDIDWSILADVTVPTLVITADADKGGIMTPEAVEQLQAYVPHIKVAHIADAGHSIHRDQFEPYMQVVQAFLKQVV